MTVSNGQLANQTTFNNGFISRTADSNTVGKVDFENVEAASGASVINVQREVNSLNAFTGRPSGSAHNATPTWTNTDVGTGTDTTKDRADSLTAEFNETTGHTHDGTAGNGGPIDLTDLTNFKAGSVAITNGNDSVGVVFTTNFSDTSYTPTFSIVNTTDADPIGLGGVITNLTTSGFVVSFDGQAQADSANYVLYWSAVKHSNP